MGCFNFDCDTCGDGKSEDGWDEREYFDAPVLIKVRRKKGYPVYLKGTYTGYGSVEACGYTFYLDQFAEYFEGWGSMDGDETIYVAGDVQCEACMYGNAATSLAEWSVEEFFTAEEYIQNGESYEAPKPVALLAPVAVPAAKPKAVKPKAAKPKALKKADLEALVATKDTELAALRAENERLKAFETRFKTLEALYNRATEENTSYKAALKAVRRACSDAGV